MSQNLAGRTVLVTGASSGIGAETARALAGAGAAVVLAARRRDRLDSLAAELAEHGGVDVLVNNAGLGRGAPISSASSEPWREMLEVNVLGLAIATREAIRDMERRGMAGHVVNVASMAAHRVPGPESGMYAATKFAVRALTEGVRQELRAKQSAIRVSLVSPGYVATEFADVFAGRPGALEALQARLNVTMLEGRDVADAILWVVTRPPHVEIHDVLVRPTQQKN